MRNRSECTSIVLAAIVTALFCASCGANRSSVSHPPSAPATLQQPARSAPSGQFSRGHEPFRTIEGNCIATYRWHQYTKSYDYVTYFPANCSRRFHSASVAAVETKRSGTTDKS